MTLHAPRTIPKLAALLLAAGESARFGGRKQLADIKGRPMIGHTLDRLTAVPELECFVVLGAFGDEIAPLVGPAAHIVHNPDWASGMGSSIASGIDAVCAQGAFDGVLITLCDQVALTSMDYDQLIARFDGSQIIATRHKNGFGVPALFPGNLFDSLKGLTGPSGARNILNGSRHDVVGIDLPNARFDIDTQDDLRTVLKQPA
ncbi:MULTISPECIES: nucleotidyltransferase family protein [Thalassospira]|uniref:MobA-like NTP transferase domain-containing protein n=2 Tax=Thalassospira TaxID=168934 RepID=A0A367W3P7_9PROT|nr:MULTISPECIES: nucleotidyltransferase family protein [Thalassospira]MDG4720819.1 nucleotidyltransferase family protein [Thalassospira sp. FZY0004]RCK34983.1 hypothetical protein TH19_14790 [Thalassospira profundimaris]